MSYKTALYRTNREKGIFSATETADVVASSDEYATRFSGEVGNYFLDVQSKITLNFLAPLPNANILDVGGGHAQLAVPLLENGFKVTVIGSAVGCRKRLDTLLPQGSFEYIACDLLDFPFDDNQFDAVLAFRLLPHMNNWEKLLSEMCRVSANIVVFDYPDIRSFNFLSSLLFKVKKAIEKNTRPFRLFSRGELLQVLHELNFGQAVLQPQFFLPMVTHRLFQCVPISKTLELFFRTIGLTDLFGSPVILKAIKRKSD